VGVCHEFGQGTAKDLEKAEEAYRRAAEAGVLWSIFNLGVMHAYRTAQKSDDVEGLALLLRAKRLAIGKSDAEKAIRDDRAGYIKKLIGRMSPSQIVEAEAASRK
jgi:TPR repeat protein